MRNFRIHFLCAVVSSLMALAGNVQAACEEKYAFSEVRALTTGLFEMGMPLTQAQNASLGQALGDLNLLSIFPKLTEHRQTIHAPFLNRLIEDLNILQRMGRRDLASLSQGNMDKAEQVFEELCESVVVMNIETQEVSQRLVFELLDFSFTNPFRGGDTADIRSYFNLSLVFFFLLGVISFIVFCWKAYILALPILKNRKSCRIKATLRALDVDVAGDIVILGTAGLRFLPDDEADSTELYDLLTGLETLPGMEIIVDDQMFAVNMHLMSVDYYVAMFAVGLGRKTLTQLFALSRVPPKFITKYEIRSNMQLINPKFFAENG